MYKACYTFSATGNNIQYVMDQWFRTCPSTVCAFMICIGANSLYLRLCYLTTPKWNLGPQYNTKLFGLVFVQNWAIFNSLEKNGRKEIFHFLVLTTFSLFVNAALFITVFKEHVIISVWTSHNSSSTIRKSIQTIKHRIVLCDNKADVSSHGYKLLCSIFRIEKLKSIYKITKIHLAVNSIYRSIEIEVYFILFLIGCWSSCIGGKIICCFKKINIICKN